MAPPPATPDSEPAVIVTPVKRTVALAAPSVQQKASWAVKEFVKAFSSVRLWQVPVEPVAVSLP